MELNSARHRQGAGGRENPSPLFPARWQIQGSIQESCPSIRGGKRRDFFGKTNDLRPFLWGKQDLPRKYGEKFCWRTTEEIARSTSMWGYYASSRSVGGDKPS